MINTFTTFSGGCYCTSVPLSNDGLGITNVQLENVNFPTTDVTYFDHSATVIDLPQELYTNLQVTFSTGWTYDTNVWIDFNDNFIFESNELLISANSTASNPTILNASFFMPTNAPLGIHKMRIGAADSGQVPPNPCFSDVYGVTLDFNVNIVSPPSCLPVNGVVSSQISSSSATVSWTATNPVPGVGYDYYISTSNTSPVLATIPTGSVAANVTSFTISTLSPVTNYFVWVRSNCSSTEFSTWSTTTSFTTTCLPVATLPWVENFDSLIAGNNVFPSCWAYSNTQNIWSISTYPSAYSGANALRRTFFTDGWAFSPLVSLTAGSTYSFGYFVATDETTIGYDITVAAGLDQTSTAMTEILSTVTGYQSPGWTEFTYNFTPAISGEYSFGLHVVADYFPYGINFDDFKIDTVLGTSNFNDEAFNFYPNPVKDILNLKYTKDITNVAVYNLLGQQVVTKNINSNQSQIDMSQLASGTYMVKITANEQVKTIKVIKK